MSLRPGAGTSSRAWADIPDERMLSYGVKPIEDLASMGLLLWGDT